MYDTYKAYTKLRDAAGVTDYRVSIESKNAQSMFTRWKHKKFTPTYPSLRRIADYFGVTVDYFYEEQE